MATIQRITKARKSKRPRFCGACRIEIVPGMPYKWYRANRFAPLLVRCVNCPDWRPSEMESTKLATAYAGQESAHDALEGMKAADYMNDYGAFDVEAFTLDVAAALESASEAAQECAAEYQESIDAMPEGLQQGPTAEEIQEKIDALESWSDDLSSWSATAELDVEPDDDAYADAVETFVDDVLAEASDVIDGLEV